MAFKWVSRSAARSHFCARTRDWAAETGAQSGSPRFSRAPSKEAYIGSHWGPASALSLLGRVRGGAQRPTDASSVGLPEGSTTSASSTDPALGSTSRQTPSVPLNEGWNAARISGWADAGAETAARDAAARATAAKREGTARDIMPRQRLARWFDPDRPVNSKRRRLFRPRAWSRPAARRLLLKAVRTGPRRERTARLQL